MCVANLVEASHTAIFMTSFHPPCARDLNSLRASNFASIATNCIQQLQRTASWLPRRTTEGVRYNYYVQLVAIKRDWMRVANMDLSPCSPQGGWKLVVNIAVLWFAKVLRKSNQEFSPLRAQSHSMHGFSSPKYTKIHLFVPLITFQPFNKIL